jgi:hypothetical protein
MTRETSRPVVLLLFHNKCKRVNAIVAMAAAALRLIQHPEITALRRVPATSFPGLLGGLQSPQPRSHVAGGKTLQDHICIRTFVRFMIPFGTGIQAFAQGDDFKQLAHFRR